VIERWRLEGTQRDESERWPRVIPNVDAQERRRELVSFGIELPSRLVSRWFIGAHLRAGV
jgi:hypothetical protein